MSEEEKKAIENLKDFAYKDGWVQVGKAKTVLNLIEKQQAELEKKDKVIDEMAKYIIELIKYNNPEEERNIEEIKEYYYKKVSDNK